MKNLKHLFPCLIIVVCISIGCKSIQQQNRNYFTQDVRDSSHTRIWQDYEIQIQKRDRLDISVTALNPASAQIFNPFAGTGANSSGSGYSVDDKGRILFPQLGFIVVEGYTRSQLRDTLLSRLRKFLTDPVVSVEFSNLKVTVLGEVGQQGPLPLSDSRISILEALGKAGNITSIGSRDSVLVIREYNNQRKFGYVNLLSNEVFKSEYFMLKQNDIVYVPILKSKATLKDQGEGGFIQKSLPYISAVTSITSLVWLIYSITR